MVGLSVSGSGTSEGRLISRKTVDLVSAVYIPVAILMICYALFTFEWRSKFMNKKQVIFVTALCAAALLPARPVVFVLLGTVLPVQCILSPGYWCGWQRYRWHEFLRCLSIPTLPEQFVDNKIVVLFCCCCCCRHQVGFFDDKVGPITLASIVFITLLAITVMAFIDVMS